MATTATALYVGAPPRRRAVPRTAVLGVALLLLVLLLAPLLFGAPSQQPCRTPAAAADVPQLTASQEANAQVIAAEGERAGVGLRGVIVALAAAMQESSLENRTTGDLDSLGLFQQRPSVGWGMPAQILTPELAADAFYGIADHTTNSGLLDISGWEAMSVAEAAQAVQRSAFPDAYATWETLATQLATRLLGGAAGAEIVSAGTSIYQLGQVQPQAVYVANLVGPMFGFTTVGGYRAYDSVDPTGHPAGLALDFMTNDIPDGAAAGDALAGYLQEHAGELDVKYVIWRQRIWSPARSAEGWRAMPDRGNPTANHFDHVHLSLNGTGEVTATAGCSGGGAAGGWYAGTSGDPNAMVNVTIIGTWSDTSADVQTTLPSLDAFTDWTGAIDIAVGGTVLGSGESYAAAASGAFDARWRAAAEALKAKRAHATGPTFVRPWHEFNGSWYTEWQVSSATARRLQGRVPPLGRHPAVGDAGGLRHLVAQRRLPPRHQRCRRLSGRRPCRRHRRRLLRLAPTRTPASPSSLPRSAEAT